VHLHSFGSKHASSITRWSELPLDDRRFPEDLAHIPCK